MCPVTRRYLAFDLGADSGRAMLGELSPRCLALKELVRFPNKPVRGDGTLQWDVLRLWSEMRGAFDRLDGMRLDGVGVDTWGCDFALIGERGNLLENPYHYRDTRHDGAMDIVCRRYGRDRLYAQTGSQIIPINTLFQLHAACERTPRQIRAATAMLMVPDLFNYWLTGKLQSEYTIASTSQMVDPRTRQWARALLMELGLPEHLLQPMVEPGSVLGVLREEANKSYAGTAVIAPGCHDTASAFAAVSSRRGAFISSGTWSLFGAEVDAPVITSEARDLNFTNEGGVCGKTRLLKNISGMWLLQSCVRAWTAAGQHVSYDALVASAADEGPGFLSLIDPDHRVFLHPADMPSAIAEVCRATGQRAPATPAACTRAVLESLAFKYCVVLDSLEQVTGVRYDYIRIVGGGARNRLLNQFTADATGRQVIAGPVEATALGNIAMQMVTTGATRDLDEARDLIDRSFKTETFEPSNTALWDRQRARFQEYLDRSTNVPMQRRARNPSH